MYNYSVSTLKLSRFLILLLLISLLFDIGGGFGLKYVAISFFLFFSLVKLFKTKLNKSFLLDVSVCLFFSAAALSSVIRGNDIAAAFAEVSFLVFVSVLVVGKGVGADFLENTFLRISFCAAIIVIITFAVIFVFPEIGIAATSFARESRLGYIGLKSIESGVPNVYFRWSSWLLLGFALSLFSKNYFLSLTIAAAAIMTLSTAVISGIILITLAYAFMGGMLQYIYVLKIFFSFVLIILVFFLAIYFFPDIFDEVISKFSANSESSSVKLGHIESILKLLSNNPGYFIYGQGPGSYFYSIGADSFVTNVEVSHFNLLRQFGMLGLSLYFFYSLYIISCLISLGSQGYPWSVGLTVMFLVAGTNPLLLSPIFFVPLMLGRVYCLESLEARKHERA